MEIKGTIGKSPIVYDVQVDAAFNVAMSLGYKDIGPAGVEMDIKAQVPLKVILDALVAKANSPTVTAVEQIFLMAVQSYLATIPAPKA